MSGIERAQLDEWYAELIAVYQNANTSHNEKENAATEILTLSRKLVIAALNDKPGSSSLDGHGRMTVIDDAGISILDMVRRYDTNKGVTFRQWLCSAKAPWRQVLCEGINSNIYGSTLSKSQIKVLSLAGVIRAEYLNKYNEEPPIPVLQAMLTERVQRRAEEPGRSIEDVEKSNNKSGFTAAIRDLGQLLEIKHAIYPDANEDGNGWNEYEREQQTVFSALEDESQATTWARLAGNDAVSKSVARSRLRCPHAQWLHLAPSLALGAVA